MLLLSVVLVAAVTWAVLHAIYASLPPLTWTGVPALLFVAAVETWLGWDLRARIAGAGSGGRRKEGIRPAAPLFVARAVVLAKATVQTAAFLGGIAVGFVVYLADMTGAPTPQADLVDSSLFFGACLILMAAALYLEQGCKIPPSDGTDDNVPPPPRESPFHGLRRPMAKTAIVSGAATRHCPGGRPPVPPAVRRCAPHLLAAEVADHVAAILVFRWRTLSGRALRRRLRSRGGWD